MNHSKTGRVVTEVWNRLRMVALAGRWYFFFLVLAGAYAVALLVGRLLGLFPHLLSPLTLLTVPLGALLLAMVFHRRPALTDAARAIDTQLQAHDLFLTATLIESSLGEYKPLVLQQAEENAARVVPQRVVNYRWTRHATHLLLASAMLAVGVYFLPTLDPLGKEKERQKLAQRAETLKNSIKATEARKALIEKRDIEAENSKEVEAAIADLKKVFNDMKPDQKEQNLARLNETQKELGQLWKQTNEEKIKNLSPPNASTQKFGAADPDKISKWKEELQKGQMTELKRELETLQKKMEQLAKTTDAQEKEKLQKEIKQGLQNLNDFVAQNANSQTLKDAISRAAEQMDTAANNQELSKEALKAAADSLKLSEQEMASLTQAVRDGKSLEEALKALQQAKRLADSANSLDGGEMAGANGIGDYAKLFEEMQKKNKGNGGPPNGPNQGGIGQGGKPDYNEQVENGFKPEKSRSALTAGKTLLEWKVREMTEKGESKLDYARQLKDVKQGVSEAILSEQIPPGYHEGIQKYFDSLDKTERPAPPPAAPPAK